MSPIIMEGLSLSLAGITITFAALALLVLTMIVLERAFRGKPLLSEKEELQESPAGGTLARDTTDEQVVAAIAVALAHLRSLDICRSGLGTALESERGSWWVAGLLQQRRVDTAHARQGRR